MKVATKIIAISILAVAASLAAGYSENYIAMALTGVIVLASGIMLAMSIAKPITEIVEDADKIAAGDLAVKVRHVSENEIGSLAKSVQKMADYIKDEVAIGRSVQLGIAIPIFMTDANTMFTFVNKPACEMMGYTSEELVGKMTSLGLFGSERATRSALSGKAFLYELSVPNRKKELIPVLAASGPVRRADGKIVGTVLTLVDMRDSIRKQREYLDQQVKPIETAIQALSEGDFTSTVEISEDSQLHALGIKVEEMIRNLGQTLGQVSETSAAVVNTSSQINSSTEELSAGAQEQSSQTSEVATAVEEMTRTVIENSKNATLTAEIAKNNGVVAKEGGEIVSRTVTKIREIAEVVQGAATTVERLGSSTQEIGEIILVIDDIADQTNLLALNAAIEAARAGEEGRGFAVVADEVRKLAERTTQATKQIASMIKNVQTEAKAAVDSMHRGSNEVGEGIKLADKAGEALKNIVGNTQQVVDMMMQIAAASEQQSSTSEEISKNVELISTVSTESANGIAQIAHAAEDLRNLTESLQSIVSNFKVSKRGRYDAHPPNTPYRTDQGQRKVASSRLMKVNP